MKNRCFGIVGLEKALESHLDSKESTLNIHLEGLGVKLKCQYFGHLMRSASSLEKTRMLGKIETKG